MKFNFSKSGVFVISKSSNVSKTGKTYNRLNLEIDDEVLECNCDDDIFAKINKHDIITCNLSYRSGIFNGNHFEVLSLLEYKKEK